MVEGREEDRRRFLKQVGTVAWASPLILTMTARGAGAQALSCLPLGTPCGNYSVSAGACVGGTSACCLPNGCVSFFNQEGDPCFCS